MARFTDEYTNKFYGDRKAVKRWIDFSLLKMAIEKGNGGVAGEKRKAVLER